MPWVHPGNWCRALSVGGAVGKSLTAGFGWSCHMVLLPPDGLALMLATEAMIRKRKLATDAANAIWRLALASRARQQRRCHEVVATDAAVVRLALVLRTPDWLQEPRTLCSCT